MDIKDRPKVKVTDAVRTYATQNNYKWHDLTYIAAEILQQTLLGEFCQMEHLALQSSFIGASIAMQEEESMQNELQPFLCAPCLHFEGLGATLRLILSLP